MAMECAPTGSAFLGEVLHPKIELRTESKFVDIISYIEYLAFYFVGHLAAPAGLTV